MRSTRRNTRFARKQRLTDFAGFTLVELLVSIAIFSMVIGIGMYALRMMFNMVRHLDAPYAEQTRKISGLRDSIAGLFFYIGEKRELFGHGRAYFNFFYGEPHEMTFVTAKSSSFKGMSVCRLYLKDGEVLLEESPVYSPANNYLNPVTETGEKKKTVLFSGVKAFNLEYYQGEKKLSRLKETFPTLISMKIDTDGGELEYCAKVRSNYFHKLDVMKSVNDSY